MFNAPLTVSEDPRVKVSAGDLEASLALSQKIAAALAKTHEDYGERQSVAKQLDVLFPEKAAKDPLRPLAEPLRRKPVPGETTFETVDSMLGSIVTDLGAVDAAPTDAQRAVVADALSKLDVLNGNWVVLKAGPLAALNAALVHAHRKPVVIPPPNTLVIEPPEEGDDLP
jgi:hypothetical protein